MGKAVAENRQTIKPTCKEHALSHIEISGDKILGGTACKIIV